jgi:arginyl-tRNA synthetase
VAQGHTPEEIAALAKTIGYGAIKYFDLKQNRVSDYGFSFEKVLDFSGNTAVFLLYSYARIRSIQRKAGCEDAKALLPTTEMRFENDTEKALALATLRFGPVVMKTAEDISPKNICDFVYDLVGCVSDFYKDCRVLGTEYQNSRLLLLEAVRLTIKQAMNLLGIDVAERL